MRTPDVKPAELFPPEILKRVDRWARAGIKVRLTREGDVLLNDDGQEADGLETVDWDRRK